MMLGKYKAVAYIDEIPEINPELCYCRWDIIITTDKGINAIKEVFIFIENESNLEIDINNMQTEYKKLGEILLEKGDISSNDLNLTLSSQKRIGEILVEQNLTGKSEIEATLAEQEYIRESRKKQQTDTISSSIKVRSDKLGVLFNIVGELIAIKARFMQTARTKKKIERITDELYNNVMNIRMLPISTTFEKFKRVVRDISNNVLEKVKLAIYQENQITMIPEYIKKILSTQQRSKSTPGKNCSLLAGNNHL